MREALSYKEAVVGRRACEKDLERKSVHYPGLCRDEQSIGGAMMNRVRGDFCQPLPYIAQHPSRKLPGVKWPGQQNLASDCNGKIELAENLQDGSNQVHQGGGRKGESPPWEGEKNKSPPWEGEKGKSQSKARRSIEQGFGGTEHDASKEQGACVTLSRVTKETTGSGSSSTSRLTKYIAATGSGGGFSTPLEITETALPAGCSAIGGTEKNFVPPQNKGSLVFEERTRSIPVVSAKTLDAEEKRSSTTRSQNESADGGGLASYLPTFANKKTVYFFPKTLNLPNYTFDMVYYQDPGESGQQI